MDIADLAQEIEHLPVTAAIAAARNHTDTIPPCGQCYNCQASVPDGHRFCDADCRDDYTKRARTI